MWDQGIYSSLWHFIVPVGPVLILFYQEAIALVLLAQTLPPMVFGEEKGLV